MTRVGVATDAIAAAGAGEQEAGADGAAVEGHLRRIAALVAPELRRLAGEVRRGRVEVTGKGGDPTDLVTRADRELEELIASATIAAFPADGFLGEEGGWRRGPSSGRNWVVDPLDGTRNFASGLPLACCSIAALGGGKRRAGLVVDGSGAVAYLAGTVSGATTLDGERLSVAAGDQLTGRIVLLEVPAKLAPGSLDPVRRLVCELGGAVRMLGSAALAMALVAAGRAQAVVHAGPRLWDMAAGTALVEAAGGAVIGPSGSPWAGTLVEPGPIIAGSPQACALLRPALAACFPGSA